MTVISTSNVPLNLNVLPAASLGTAKTSNGHLLSAFATNTCGTTRFLQFFDGTIGNGGTPVLSFPLPGGAALIPTVTQIPNTYLAVPGVCIGQAFGQSIGYAISATDGTLGTAAVTSTQHSINIRYI